MTTLEERQEAEVDEGDADVFVYADFARSAKGVVDARSSSCVVTALHGAAALVERNGPQAVRLTEFAEQGSCLLEKQAGDFEFTLLVSDRS